MTTEQTPVIFRYCPQNQEVVAFLPSIHVNYGRILCYSHIGQHSEASLEYYWATDPIRQDTEDKKEELKRELQSMSNYQVKEYKKLSNKLYDQLVKNWSR